MFILAFAPSAFRRTAECDIGTASENLVSFAYMDCTFRAFGWQKYAVSEKL